MIHTLKKVFLTIYSHINILIWKAAEYLINFVKLKKITQILLPLFCQSPPILALLIRFIKSKL
jgi:hypothetical protein